MADLFSPDPYDTEVNEPLMDSRTSISKAISNLYGGTIGTVVDIGASIFNSLPGTEEVQTEDILGRIGGDALRVYQESPDAVRTASLIGGAILPGGVAVKGLNLVRNGSKAVNWFSAAGKTANMEKAANLFRQGRQSTSEYKNLLWGMRGRALANNTLDAAAAELAVLGTMNAHPYMEDYLKDPATNFGIGVMLGGGLGTLGGVIGDAMLLRKATGAIEQEALDTVYGAVRPVGLGMTDATKVQTDQLTLDALNELLTKGKEQNKIPANDLAMSYAEKMARDIEYQNGQRFESMLDGKLKELDAPDKRVIQEEITSNPAMWGVQKISHAEIKDDLPIGAAKSNLLQDKPTLEVTNKLGEKDLVTAAYFPDIKRFGSQSDVRLHAGAAALNTTEEALVKAKPDKLSMVPNFDYALESIGKSTPHVEADYVAWTSKFGKMSDDDFESYMKKAILSSEDIPQLQAIAVKMGSSSRLKNTVKIRMADKMDEAEAIIDEVNIKRTLGGTPVKYQQAADRILNNATVTSKYSFAADGSVGGDALHGWIAGDTYPLQKAATAFFSKGFVASSRTPKDMVDAELMRAIYHHPKSEALRKDLMNIADKDGKIYLYRGVKASKIYGQAPLESMAISVDKTRQFTGKNGQTLLYKVDVDDVVASFVDVGHGSNNVELIVRASARDAEATLSPEGRIAFRKQLERNLATTIKHKEAAYGDVADYLQEAKYKQLQHMLNRGFPPEVMAKRVNMPLDTVNQFLASDRSFDTFQSLGNLIGFKSAEEARAALSVRNKPLLLRGAKNKADYTEHHAKLDAKTLNNIDTLFKSTQMFNSTSPTVRSIADTLFQRYAPALDILRTKLSLVNNELAGSNFYSSADQFVRHMEDIGPVLTTIGKDITHIANRTSSEILQPITEFMVKVADKEASLVEFNVAANLNASLKGFRIYKDKQFWQKVMREAENGKMVEVLEPVTFQGRPFTVATDETDELLTKIQQTGKDLYEMRDVSHRITGKGSINNTGFWMPAMNPVNKFIAYLHDQAADVTRMVYGRTQAELDDALKSFAGEQLQNPNLLVVTKDNQKWWSYVNGRLDPVNMEMVDASKLKTGSGASAIVSTGRDILSEIAGGYEHMVNASVRNLADLSMSDITDTLRKYSTISGKALEAQPLSFVKRVLNRPKDTGTSAVNILLGNSSIGEYEGWQTANRTFEAALAKGSQTVSAIWKNSAPSTSFFKKGKKIDASKMKEFDYEAFAKRLEDEGVVNPFAIYDKATAVEKYGISQLTDNPEVPRRIIAAGNSMAATLALRMGELAHPIVNLMSMPILTSLANAKNLPATFMGVTKGTAEASTARIMYDGMRAMNSPRFAALNRKWEDLGYFQPLVSEATEILKATRKFEKGALANTEKLLESGFVNFMSKPADFSEAMSRKIMMNTGAQLAKRIYPELDDNGVTIFARDFMDKAIGNYSAAQRPVMFQGTMGMALGLFQTYMLTMAQGVYRAVEFKDWKTLAKASMAQSTIFGTASMPGFQQVSEMIGEHFSEDHFDLTTGTYRAVGDKADWILYGLPTNLTGASIYTRGDVDPRFPNVFAGVDNVVAVNMAAQSAEMVKSVARAMGEGESSGQAMLQALSLQTLSRPLARAAEVGMATTGEGGSINRAGNTVQTAEEVLTFNGIAARAFAMRPFEEGKLREGQYLNRFYEAADRDIRKDTVNKLRTAIRAGKNTPEKVSELAEEYMRKGGSPTGWRAAYRTAIARTNVAGEDTFISDLDESSPLQHMINSLD